MKSKYLYLLTASDPKACVPFHLRPRRACLRSGLVLLAALAFCPPRAQAVVTEAWVHRYNNVQSNSTDLAYKIARDGAGDVFVIGETGDGFDSQGMLIIKYSGVNGAVLWQKRHPVSSGIAADAISAMTTDGSGNLVVAGNSLGDYYTAKYAAADGTLLWGKRYNGPANGNDGATSVAVDSGGNVIVTGFSKIGIDDDDLIYARDYYTAKYAAANGALLWEKRYDGPVGGDDFAEAVAMDSSGNVVVTGFSDGVASGYDCYTAKYAAANGSLLWEKRYNGPANRWDFGYAVAMDASGNAVVTGTSASGSGEFGESVYDYYTAKYAAADGALLWEKRYDGTASVNDIATAVVVDSNGNVVVTGFSDGIGSGKDFYTAKYAVANGALLWEKRYNGPGSGTNNLDDRPNSLVVDADGNVMVTGFSPVGNNLDNYAVKYGAATGAVLWERRTINSIRGAVMDGSGNVIVTGIGYAAFDFVTAKYGAADGAVLWEKNYNGPSNRPDAARALAVDASGNVAVTGSSYSYESGEDYYTAKYAATDGALLWEKRYDGPIHSRDLAQAMVMDAGGNVVVTGQSGADYYTAKYAAADGSLLWEKRGATINHDRAQSVAVDGNGNVVVTGSSLDGNEADYYTAKYAAANGALLWEKYYDGPAHFEDSASAVAVDGSGNVLVTGTSYQFFVDGLGSFYADFYTAKYAAANGALLWQKSYNGPANSEDSATALAVDGSGNVIVTGQSGNDCYTAKYAAATGALLWEKRSTNGFGLAVALDTVGNVVVTGNFATLKYAAATGTLLWEKRYTNIGWQAVAVDTSNNVVVAGQSGGDYYTAKYASADGSLLWEKTYNGPATGDDALGSSHCLALGPNDMVAITGASDGDYGPSVTTDYATVVYRETPPSLSIVRSNAFAIISWPVTGLTFQLQENTDVSLANSWSPVAQSSVTNAGQISVTVPMSAGQKFFRLSTLSARSSQLFYDSFSYPDGPLVNVATNSWLTHSGTTGEVGVVSGRVDLRVLASEDVSHSLR